MSHTHTIAGKKPYSVAQTNSVGGGLPKEYAPGTPYTPTEGELRAFPDRFKPIERPAPPVEEAPQDAQDAQDAQEAAQEAPKPEAQGKAQAAAPAASKPVNDGGSKPSAKA